MAVKYSACVPLICDIHGYKVFHDALTWKPVCEKLLQSKKDNLKNFPRRRDLK
jgi:hypothetical protein